MKTLSIAAIGFATSQARWYWPAETQKQYLDDYESWDWIALPVDSDFPFKDQAQWFFQGDFNDVVGQRDWVKAWYQTDGYTGVAVDYQTAVGNVFSGSNQWAHCYEFNAETKDVGHSSH